MNMRAYLAMLCILLPFALAGQESFDEVKFTADHTTFFEAEYYAVLKGNASLKSDRLQLKGDEVVVEFAPTDGDEGELELKSIKAVGNVWSKNGDIVVTAEKMDYDEATEFAIYTGDAEVTQGKRVLRADEVRMDVKNEIYEGIGAVSGKFRGTL